MPTSCFEHKSRLRESRCPTGKLLREVGKAFLCFLDSEFMMMVFLPVVSCEVGGGCTHYVRPSSIKVKFTLGYR